MTIRFVCLMLVATIFLSCGERKVETYRESSPQTTGSEPQFLPSTFAFDDQLVGDTVTVSEISVRVPIGWEAMNPATIRQMQVGAAKDTGQFRHQPTAAYSAVPSCRMLMSSLPLSQPTNDDFVWWARDLALVFRNVRTNATIQESWMTMDGIRAMVLYAKDSAMLHYKVVLETHPPVSLDYSYPVKSAELQEPKIKSSIASVKRMAATG